MLIADILKKKGNAVKTVRSKDTAMECARRMRTEHIGAMIVSDNGKSVDGIVTERDIAYALADQGTELYHVPVAELMTKAVICCSPRDAIVDVTRVMTQRRIRHVPVQEGSHLVGIVSIGDVLKYRLEEMQLEANVLRDHVIATR